MNQPQPHPSPNPAQAYEEHLVPFLFCPWAAELLDRARPQPGERVLDVACGTGIVARMIAQQLNGQGDIVGLDHSPAMVEVARSVAAREGLAIEWHIGSADALPFPDASFDLVTIQQALQFFPNKAKAAALGEVYRVLASGGRVVTATWTDIANNPFNHAFAEVIDCHLGTPAMHTPFSLGDQRALHTLFIEAGFETVAIERVRRTVRRPSPETFVDLSIDGAAAAIPALQGMNAAERAALTEAVRADMAAPLGAYTKGGELVYPMEINIVAARKTN
ncbi:MAG: methyltransferase domain-containing protein [Chloroflexota bacterium]|nr:methyltransferase domain-containing protein [Chloroflexota bacterium]